MSVKPRIEQLSTHGHKAFKNMNDQDVIPSIDKHTSPEVLKKYPNFKSKFIFLSFYLSVQY